MKPSPSQAIAIAILWAIPAAAQAQSCSLQLVNTVSLSVRDDRLTVPASVNGVEMPFEIDTAAIAPQMNRDAAAAFKLPQGDPNISTPINSGAGALTGIAGSIPGANMKPGPNTDIFDAQGNLFQVTARAKEFVLGVMHSSDVSFTVTNFPPPGTGGILNVDFFHHYDIDLNPVGGKFNMFSPDHCKGKVLYWRAPGMAALPMRYQDNRITVRVSVDGKEMDAIIDTGAPSSQIKLDDATRLFGVGPDSPGVTLVGPANGDSTLNRYAYDFKTLSFGDVSIDNPHLLLTRAVLIRGANPNAPTGSHIRNSSDSPNLPPLVIGANLLKLLHVYIAVNDRMLYVTQGPEMAPGAAGAQPVVAVAPFRP